jgi:hypothetical protein
MYVVLTVVSYVNGSVDDTSAFEWILNGTLLEVQVILLAADSNVGQ